MYRRRRAPLCHLADGRHFISGKLDLSDSAKELIAREGYDPVYGARPLKRTIQKEILDPLSINILEGKVREGQTVRVNARDGALAFTTR